MDHRVYDFSELPAHLSILDPHEVDVSSGAQVVVRAPLAKVSPAGGILNAQVKVERERLLEVRLELPGTGARDLRIQVLKASSSGVFFAWYPPSDEQHAELETALSRAKEEYERNGVAVSPRAVNHGIRDRARPMNALELAARHRTVHVLELSTIEKLLDQAVTEAAGRLQKRLTEEEESRLRRETEERFEERMAILKAEKTSLAERVQVLEDQQTKAEELLEEERQRVIRATQFTVSDAGLIELDQRLTRLLETAIRGKSVPAGLEDDLRAIVTRLLDDEREKIAEQARLAQSDTIELLERKVRRLADSLEETRVERDRAKKHALALEEAQGGGFVTNHYKVGLEEDDPERVAKLGLLKQLMEDNQELRAFASARSS